MKELGVVRFRDFGDKKQAQQMHMFGRKLLGEMKQEMQIFGVKFLKRKIQLSSGIIFMISSNMIGLAPIDEIQTFVPFADSGVASEGKEDRIIGFMATFTVDVRVFMLVYEPEAVDKPLAVKSEQALQFLETSEFDIFAGYDTDGTHTDNTTDITGFEDVAYFMTSDWYDDAYIEWTYIDPEESQEALDEAEGQKTWNRHKYSSHILNYRKRESDLFGFGGDADMSGGALEYRDLPVDDNSIVNKKGTAVLPPTDGFTVRYSEAAKDTYINGTANFVLPGHGSTFTQYFSGGVNTHDWTMPKLELKKGDYRLEMLMNESSVEGKNLKSTIEIILFGENGNYNFNIEFTLDQPYAPAKPILNIAIGKVFENDDFMSVIEIDENL
ncbi:MAG: hypothetical protein KAJ39_03090 [Gammaproteobacteria bacterium]|nr:hypothetical protein [Gammaproteobacteria bacterium]